MFEGYVGEVRIISLLWVVEGTNLRSPSAAALRTSR